MAIACVDRILWFHRVGVKVDYLEIAGNRVNRAVLAVAYHCNQTEP